MVKGLHLLLVLLLVASIGDSLAQDKKSKKIIKIGVTRSASYQVFDADEKGFEKRLAERGFKERVSVIYDRQNARGNMANAQAIAPKLLDAGVDLIHSIGTPASQAVVKTIRSIPIVFSSVTDPVDAGLVPKTSPPGTKTGTNVTGVSDPWPVSPQFEMYLKFVPKAKKWGTIYNPADPYALFCVKEMRKTAKKLGVEMVEATGSSNTEITQAALSLAGRVQAILIAPGSIVRSSFEAIVKVCNEKKIPLFAGDPDNVPRGAIAAYGLDYFAIGLSAGSMAADILEGKKAGDIPWGPVEAFSLIVSEKAAKAQGVVIPFNLLKKADKIVEE